MAGNQGTTTYGSALAELDSYLGDLQKSAAAAVVTPAAAQADSGAKPAGKPMFNSAGLVGAPAAKEAATTSEDSTTHPVEGADDQLAPATEGSRSAENRSDIVSDVPGQSIDDAPPSTDEEPAPVALTEAATTGKDPANETSGVKMQKDDPGTTHPATVGGEKGAGYLDQVKQACVVHGAEKVATEIGNSLMADIAILGGEAPAPAAARAAAPTDVEKAAQAGATAADSALDAQVDEQFPDLVEGVTKQANTDAKNLLAFYKTYDKRAMDEDGTHDPEEAVPGEGNEAGEAGGEGALPPEDLAQLAGIAGAEGGGGMPPEGGGMPYEEGAMPPEGGGMPPEEGGMPPEGGGMPGGEMGGMDYGPGGEGGMGEPGEDEIVQALSEALADAGVTPEELAAAVAAQEGGGEASLEQKMAAMNIAKLASEEVNRYRNLKSLGRIKNVKRASLQLTWSVRQMIKDVVGK